MLPCLSGWWRAGGGGRGGAGRGGAGLRGAGDETVEGRQAIGPEHAVVLDPVGGLCHRRGVQREHMVASLHGAADESRLLEHADVLRHRVERDREVTCHIRDAFIRRREADQDLAPGRIGDGPEHPVESLCLIFTHTGEYTPMVRGGQAPLHSRLGPIHDRALMIPRRLLTATLSATVGAMIALGLAGCDFFVPQTTETTVETSDGVSGTIGQVHVGNAVLISGDAGQLSNLVVTFSNLDFVDHDVAIQGTGTTAVRHRAGRGQRAGGDPRKPDLPFRDDRLAAGKSARAHVRGRQTPPCTWQFPCSTPASPCTRTSGRLRESGSPTSRT